MRFTQRQDNSSRFAYGSSPAFPNSSYNTSNY